MYQAVLGATTATTAAVVLPNTGNSKLMAVVASVTLVVGVAIVATSVARLIAKKAYKA